MTGMAERVRVVELLSQGNIGTNVVVCGWVRTRRDSKEFSFLELNDGSCLGNLQIIVDKAVPNYEKNIVHIHTGSALLVQGTLCESPGKGQRVELRAKTVEIFGTADPELYPLQKKGHSFEFLRTIAHLRPRTNTFGAVFRVRHTAAYAVHKFFHDRGFVYLHTPIITTSDCEGAGQMFQVTTIPLDELVKSNPGASVPYQKDFFGRPASLTVSGQLEGELFALALSDIYTFGPTFRAENSNTARHLAEFWMIEPEMAFCDLQGNMRLAEDFVRFVLKFILENCQEDLKFFDDRIEKGIIAALEKVIDASFRHMPYTDAISVLEKSGKKFEHPVHWGMDIQTEHERFLAEEYVSGPVFVTNYPKEIKSFYMRLDEGEKTVSAMDLLVPRLGEIIGGSQREERYEVLSRRIQECGLKPEDYWWYLETRKFGSAPHAGFGLGFERLVMYLTGMQNIRDVIPFPRTPGNAEF